MARSRSPNYPLLNIEQAIEATRSVFSKEVRNKMAREVLAKNLGYKSLNGRALGKIAALKAYGLIEGSGNELQVSDDAVILLEAPTDAPERQETLHRCALRPPLFAELSSEFDTLPSDENLRFSLIRRKFTPDAAEKATQVYRETISIVSGLSNPYGEGDEPTPKKPVFDPPIIGSGSGAGFFPTPPAPPGGERGEGLNLMSGERELTTGLLSKEAKFRVIVSGNVGVKEIERLIQKLEFDKEILADTDDDSRLGTEGNPVPLRIEEDEHGNVESITMGGDPIGEDESHSR